MTILTSQFRVGAREGHIPIRKRPEIWVRADD